MSGEFRLLVRHLFAQPSGHRVLRFAGLVGHPGVQTVFLERNVENKHVVLEEQLRRRVTDGKKRVNHLVPSPFAFSLLGHFRATSTGSWLLMTMHRRRRRISSVNDKRECTRTRRRQQIILYYIIISFSTGRTTGTRWRKNLTLFRHSHYRRHTDGRSRILKTTRSVKSR